jgi:hypothetical protein
MTVIPQEVEMGESWFQASPGRKNKLAMAYLKKKG